MELFEEFFELQNNQKMNDEQKLFVKGIMEEIHDREQE